MIKRISVACLLVTALVATEANAQQQGERRRPPSPEMVIKHLDKDGDSKISKDEANKAERGRLKDHFDKVDTNKDGFIEAKELEAFHKNRPPRGREQRD